MNKFEKVSFEQFYKDCNVAFPNFSKKLALKAYNNIKLPQRATKDSAGYDFYSPFDFTLDAGKEILIPTGIRVHINEGWFLGCVPRSGLGFNYRFQLNNVFGVIDALYVESDNEGHIHAKMINDSRDGKILHIEPGKAFMQGIFLPFGITVDDNATGVRNGGYGSTDKNK